MKLILETKQMVLVLNKNILRKYTTHSDAILVLENKLVVNGRIVFTVVSGDNLTRISIPLGEHLYYEHRDSINEKNLVVVKDLDIPHSDPSMTNFYMLTANALGKILYNNYNLITSTTVQSNTIKSLIYFYCGGYKQIIGVISQRRTGLMLSLSEGVDVDDAVKLSTIISFLGNMVITRTKHESLYLEK